MAKRILAIVMALVLSLSMLTVFASAAGGTSWEYEFYEDTTAKTPTIVVSWDDWTDATKYTVDLYRDYGKSPYSTKTVTVTKSSKNEAVFSNLPAGVYDVEITIAQKDYRPYTVRSIDSSRTVTIKGKVTSKYVDVNQVSANTVRVSWEQVVDSKGNILAKDYMVEYTHYDENVEKNLEGYVEKAGTTGKNDTFTQDINVAWKNLKSVTVSYHDSKGNKKTLGSVNVSTGASSGGSSSSGDVWLDGYTLNWNPVTGAARYCVYYTVAGGSSNQYTTTYTGVDVTNVLASAYGRNVTFTVVALNYAGVQIANLGTVSTNGTSTSGNLGLTARLNGTTTYNVSAVDLSWNDIGYEDYIVSYNYNYNYSNYNYNYGYGYNLIPGAYNTDGDTEYSVPYYVGVSCTIVIYGVSNNRRTALATVNVSEQGQITYGNTNTTTSGTTVNGSNCTLVVGSTSSTLTWYSGTAYQVLYTANGTTLMANISGTNTATIPVGQNTSFEVFVIGYGTGLTSANSVIATAVYTASSSSSNSTTVTSTKVTNLVLTAKGSGSTTVSWNAVSNAVYYTIDYARGGASATETTYTTKTSVDIPFGTNSSYVVYVYAYLSSGRNTAVGSATHKAGDAYTSGSSSNNSSSNNNSSSSTTTGTEFVTNLKATSGNKKVSLSWNAASGNPTYTVYWKRSNASDWKKAGTTSKRSVNITGLNNGVSYDFKVVANGKDSGIVTISPSSSGSTTKTAPDPAGAVSTTPSITSIEGGSGTMTISWNAVKGATSYQIWIAKSDSSTYAISTHPDYFPNAKTSISGTTATISGLPAGSYKVRIKYSTDGKTYSSLSECPYKSVTVK